MKWRYIFVVTILVASNFVLGMESGSSDEVWHDACSITCDVGTQTEEVCQLPVMIAFVNGTEEREQELTAWTKELRQRELELGRQQAELMLHPQIVIVPVQSNNIQVLLNDNIQILLFGFSMSASALVYSWIKDSCG